MKKRLRSSTVRSEAELDSGDARRVAGTADRRNARLPVDAGGVATSTCGNRGVIVRERRRPAPLGVAAALG
ncbi:hypothetical protein HQO90_20445 [Rhodococcus fascians]|nr:hypothetical protein [Rhodococcus fascians]